jgi:hypothetical protein
LFAGQLPIGSAADQSQRRVTLANRGIDGPISDPVPQIRRARLNGISEHRYHFAVDVELDTASGATDQVIFHPLRFDHIHGVKGVGAEEFFDVLVL